MYFIGFALLLIGLIWFLQIFFLNNYYGEMKRAEITKLANQIINAYEEQNNDPFKLTDILEDIYASNEDIYIQVESSDGTYQIVPDYEEHFSLYRYRYNLQIQSLRTALESSPLNRVSYIDETTNPLTVKKQNAQLCLLSFFTENFFSGGRQQYESYTVYFSPLYL